MLCLIRFSIVINSNGSLITSKIAKELRKYRFDRICITLDGSKADIHDIMRGKGSFIKAIEGIQELQKNNLPVSTLFTLNKTNVSNLIDTIKLNHLLGINYMTVMIVCPTGRASDGSMLIEKEDWYPVFLELTKMKSENRMPLKFSRLDLLKVWNQDVSYEREREISCSAGIRAASVSYNGDIYGCDLMTGIEEFKAGSIKHNTFKKIWNESETFKVLREMSFEKIEGKCNTCKYTWCGGSCRSAAYNLNGSLYSPDTSCFYAVEDIIYD